MKPTVQLGSFLLCFALCQASAQSDVKYWDSNGAAAGAGDTPNGTWDADPFWSADAAGGVATTGWTDGDTAVFSAGTDATNAFDVTVNGTVNPAGITFEEGLAVISGGTISITNSADFPIVANADAVINSYLSGAGFKKTGPGKLTLGADNFSGGLGGANTIAEGIVAITNTSALGYALTPTVVSNGASVEVSTSISFGNYITLNGFGVSNRGALYGYVGTTGQTVSRTGGAVINSDARINHYGTGGSWWNWTTQVITTNGNNSADLYIGGTGNTIRLNMNIDYPSYPGYRRPCIDIGDGVLYKDGSVELRLENSNIAREVRFNEGHIMGRCGPGTNICYRAVVPGLFYVTEGAFWASGDYVPATIYVGPNAGEFRNAPNGPPQEWDHPIVLAAGAKPTFRPRDFTGAYFICNGVISGQGGLSKYNDTGTLYLKATNTYSGNTTIRGGFLTLGVNGSISNSAVIDVWTNGVFNVTSNAAGFVLQPAQTLLGDGTVLGNVTALGTISPGASVGSLTNDGNLTLSGSILIDVDKSLSPNSSNDLITVTGSLSHGGGASLTVANLGPALAVGDSFQIFSKAVSGGGTITVSGAGATWANHLAVDGSIAVTGVAPPAVPATNVTIRAAGPTSYQLGGLGAASSVYDVYAATNLATPVSNWWKIGSTNSSAGGVIEFLDTQATNRQRFYRFGQTVP
jgi:autotransporter-associated beta strand protein